MVLHLLVVQRIRFDSTLTRRSSCYCLERPAEMERNLLRGPDLRSNAG